MKAKELRDSVIYGLAGIDDQEQLLTADEFAKRHGYSGQGIRTILSREKVPRAFKVGRTWYIPEHAKIVVKKYNKNK